MVNLVIRKLTKLRKLEIVSSTSEVELDCTEFLKCLRMEMKDMREITFPNKINFNDLYENLRKRPRGIKMRLMNMYVDHIDSLFMWRNCP